MVEDFERVRGWVEAGKQAGLTVEFSVAGEACWTSVAVQKWSGRYKVYVDEIKEAKMVAEEYEREDVRVFDTVDDAARYVSDRTRVKFEDLRPCKGQRIFNPEFDE